MPFFSNSSQEPSLISGSALDSTSESGTLNELSSLIPIRFRHQSEEEAGAVRVASTRNTQVNAGALDSASNESEDSHNPKAVASRDSERWQLLKKINEIIKVSGNSAESGQGESTGLNRHNRWTTGKVAAGSSVYATSSHATSGNVANAQATARRSAQMVCSIVFLAFSGNI